ncbi:MAG: DUF3261 domain-containing protein [Spirochaetales bacterium]|jgi:hypothetical protein|nr:DUF3261 domain-containing protein [Spirochaetales bacterium]
MAQHISGAYGKQKFLLEAWIQADDTRLNMSFFNGLGTAVGDLVFRETEISFDSVFFPSSFKPEYIVADFQFCFYRAEALSPALEKCGLSLLVEHRGAQAGEKTELRIISDAQKPVIEIEKTQAFVRYTNYMRGYTYTLEGEF